MRTFHIFKINREFTRLTRHVPYNLYMALNGIYKSSVKDVYAAYSLFDSMNEIFKKDEIKTILKDMYSLDGYQNYGSVHTYHDYYNNESSKLIVHSSYLVLKTNKATSSFFKKLMMIPNLFVCDFENSDYFWLSDIKNLALV